MKDIKINDMQEEVVLDAEAMEAVKGGPAYIKLGDIKGESKFRVNSRPSFNFEEIKVT